MNIEESVEYLKNCLNDEYNFKNATRKKDKEAIETLLTAYEKEKEKNKTLEELLQGNLFKLYKHYKDLASSYQANSVSKDKIKAEIKELQNMKVDGEVFTTSVNYAIMVLQSLLEKE